MYSFKIINQGINRKGLLAIENGVLESKKIEFGKDLIEKNEKISEWIHDLNLIIAEFKNKYDLKSIFYLLIQDHSDSKQHEKIKEIVKEEILNFKSSLINEIKNIFKPENSKSAEDCVATIEKNRNEYLKIRDIMSNEIQYLKSEIGKLKSNTGEFCNI